ncbi:MAG TPA: DUF1559 domain-containing protein [Fimbriiglobus sp.]|jgi:prepilin-type processing-associated H-X9-DG protein
MKRRRLGAVIFLLISVLAFGFVLTGIEKLRAERDRTSCQNKLRQLSLAYLNYRDCNGCLPPLTDQGQWAQLGRGLPSVFASLMPFIEASPIYFQPKQAPDYYYAHSSVPFTYGEKDGTTGTYTGGMANQIWPVFLDPADTTAVKLRDIPMTLPDGATGYYATGSYVANGLLPWGVRKLTPPILEDSANTIMFAERPQICRTAAGETVYNLWGLGIYSPHMPAFATVTPTDPPGLWPTGQIVLADDVNPVQELRVGQSCDPRLPGKLHPGGMNVAMADGSVRVFRSDVSPAVFWAACKPAGSR